MKLLNFFGRVFRKHVDMPLPRTSSEIADYATGFNNAVEFTTSCGFPLRKVTWLDGNVLDQAGDFIAPAMHAAGVCDVSQSAAQCLKWCHYLTPTFEQQLDCKVWITLGQIWKGDRAVFSPTWDDMKRWSNHGIQINDFSGRQGLNFHVWLTLESGEIIDPTFPSSLAAFGGVGYAKLAGGIVWGRDPYVLNNHRYFPMAVGREFAEAIGRKSIVPLLATNSIELHQVSAMIVHD